MAEIDVENDLVQINQQIEQLVTQLNQINSQREQITQQVHNLNGISMYLRGKQGSEENGMQPIEDLERIEEYPDNMLTKDG